MMRLDKVLIRFEDILQSDLLLSALDGVRAVANVAADSQSVIATDGAFK